MKKNNLVYKKFEQLKIGDIGYYSNLMHVYKIVEIDEEAGTVMLEFDDINDDINTIRRIGYMMREVLNDKKDPDRGKKWRFSSPNYFKSVNYEFIRS